MNDPKDDDVKALVDFKKGDIESHGAFAELSKVRSENTWLANFSSQNTREGFVKLTD